MHKLCVIVTCTERDSQEILSKTYEAFTQGSTVKLVSSLVIWCSQCASSFVKFAQQIAGAGSDVHVIDSAVSYLEDPSFALSVTLHCCCADHILLCSCGIIPNENFFTLLENKVEEYKDAAAITAFGVRLFPHDKLNNVALNMKEGMHWKMYNSSQTDRAVHFFTPEFSCISVSVIRQVVAYQDGALFLQLGHLWFSYVLGHILGQSVWKIQASDIADFSSMQEPTVSLYETIEKSKQFESFYSHIYKCDWPRGISAPLKRSANRSSSLPQEVWKRGFGGVNMSSTPASEMDFEAAAAYGVTVIRVGAVCDGKDLAYLIDRQASTCEEDQKHFLQVVPKLRSAILKASQHGLKVIITMTDLPGCPFHSRPHSPTFSFWDSPLSMHRAVKFWGMMAESLVDMSDKIMGYDLINEPYTPEDMKVHFFDDVPLSHKDQLNTFYSDALQEIRNHDQNVAVIVKGTWFASPKAFTILQPLPDANVIYAFHMYAPPYLTLHRRFGRPGFSYPGPVRRWLQCPWYSVDISQQYLHKLLEETVHQWQIEHSIPSTHILVAEFGICREIRGAMQYLRDVVDIFKHFGWSWLLFSFRDEEWDALDYELGPDMDNMLDRSASELFMTVANHFH